MRERDGRSRTGPGLTWRRLVWLQATLHKRWAAACWLSLTVAAGLTVGLPLLATMATESAFADALTHDAELTVEQPATADAEALSAFQKAVDGRVAQLDGDLGRLTTYATTASFSIIDVNGAAPARELGGRRLVATYIDHLKAHVDFTGGRPPPDGLGGGEAAVTVAQRTADVLGLHLSDRFCVGTASGPNGPGPWCGRVVGLWRPLDSADPYWAGELPLKSLTMARYDLFELARLLPTPTAVAGLRFRPDPDLVTQARAPEVGRRVAELRVQLAAAGYRVSTHLDRALTGFAASRDAVSYTMGLFGWTVTLLGLLAVAVVSGRFLEQQSREFEVLRVRGWPLKRTRRLAVAGLTVLAGLAVLAGLGGCLALAETLTVSGTGLSIETLQPVDLLADLARAVIVLAGLAAVLVARASTLGGPLRPTQRPVGRQLRTGAAGLLLMAATPLLGFWRMTGWPQASVATVVLGGLAPAVGVMLLALAAVSLQPLVVRVTVGRRADLPTVLAGEQLGRSPDQHAGASLVMILTAAVGVLAVAGAAAGLAPGTPEAFPVAIRLGLELGMLAGFAGALTMALVAVGLHFLSIARRRLREYLSLFAQGLPADLLARSLTAEQLVIARSSLPIGGLCGLILMVIVLPELQLSAGAMVLAGMGLIAVALVMLGGILVIGRLVRRLASRRQPDAAAAG